MARTNTDRRLPRLFKFLFESLGKTPIAADIIMFGIITMIFFFILINRIYDGVEAETRKSQASFPII